MSAEIVRTVRKVNRTDGNNGGGGAVAPERDHQRGGAGEECCLVRTQDMYAARYTCLGILRPMARGCPCCRVPKTANVVKLVRVSHTLSYFTPAALQPKP